SGPAAPSGGPASITFMGTTQTGANGGCIGNAVSHQIAAGEGTVTVTLVQASESPMKLQICHPSAVNHALECTVPPFVPIAVGQSVSATLRGGRAQIVTVFPAECGGPTAPPGPVVSYTITVVYPQ
ncbi:MAG TPA: hypothetical protein VIZ31_00960, partial [Vicinamibacteria bacterium]